LKFPLTPSLSPRGKGRMEGCLKYFLGGDVMNKAVAEEFKIFCGKEIKIWEREDEENARKEA